MKGVNNNHGVIDMLYITWQNSYNSNKGNLASTKKINNAKKLMQFTINNRANFLEVWWCYFTKGRPFMFCAFSIRLDIKLDNENVRDMRKVHCRY